MVHTGPDGGRVYDEMLAELQKEVAVGWYIDRRSKGHIKGVGASDESAGIGNGDGAMEVDGDLGHHHSQEDCKPDRPHFIIT
jgi:hypothetical protein